MRSAVWLCRNCSHQWRAMNSGSTTVIVSFRTLPLDFIDVGQQRTDDARYGRFDDHERYFGVDPFPVSAHLLDLGLIVGDVDGRDVRGNGASIGQRLPSDAIDGRDRHDRPCARFPPVERRLRSQFAGSHA